MNITRLNADFGNSYTNFRFDSYYIEIPTIVTEIKKEKAESLFTGTVDEVKDLLDRLVICIKIEDEDRYFVLGNMAAKEFGASTHVEKMHDKIKSPIPYAIFMAAVAYYYKLKNPQGENKAVVDINAMKMMLPNWLLKKEAKFSIALEKMEKRFVGEHQVTLLTPGMETELTVKVNQPKCYIEGEVARWALKYKIVNDEEQNATIIVKRPEASMFDDTPTVFSDLGGGSVDDVLLAPGLNAPVSRESFQIIDIEPFLGRLERLRKEKLIEYFEDLKSLESFIVDNYKEQKYILEDENTGRKYDLTNEITEVLKEYAEQLSVLVTNAYNTDRQRKKYVYFGGEAPILAPYIQESIVNLTSEKVLENNHFFLHEFLQDDENEVFKPTARTLNLEALEILSLNEQSQN